MGKICRLSFLYSCWVGVPCVGWVVVGARVGGLALCFLLLLHFSLEEKNQHLIQSEIPVPTCLHLTARLRTLFTGGSVFVGAEDRLRSQLKNGPSIGPS